MGIRLSRARRIGAVVGFEARCVVEAATYRYLTNIGQKRSSVREFPCICALRSEY